MFANKPLLLCVLFSLGLFFTGCDGKRVFDDYTKLDDYKWPAAKVLSFKVEIADTLSAHNVFVSLRNISQYPYSNLYMQFGTQAPGTKLVEQRLQFRLANDEGQWLGKGAGDLWDNQIAVLQGVRFQKAGTYVFTLRQDMREDPLLGIADAGVRIEKAEAAVKTVQKSK